jgi:hypothetical protein
VLFLSCHPPAVVRIGVLRKEGKKNLLLCLVAMSSSGSPLESFGRTLYIVTRNKRSPLPFEGPVNVTASSPPFIDQNITSPYSLSPSPSPSSLSFPFQSPLVSPAPIMTPTKKKRKINHFLQSPLDTSYRSFYDQFIEQYRRKNKDLLLDFHHFKPCSRMRPTIVSVNVMTRVGSPLLLERLLSRLFMVETRSEILVWLERYTQVHCEINSKGDIRTVGADNIENAVFAATMCFYQVKKAHNAWLSQSRNKKCNPIDSFQGIEIVELTAKVEVGFSIRLNDLYLEFPSGRKHHPSDSLEYDTERHSFLLYYYFRDPALLSFSSPASSKTTSTLKRPKNEFVTISVYPYGKVMIKGAQTPKEINEIWEFFSEFLPQYQNKCIQQSSAPPLCLFCNLPEHTDLSQCHQVASDYIPSFPLQESDLQLDDVVLNLFNKSDVLF